MKRLTVLGVTGSVGRRTLEAGEIEAQVRRGREQRSVPLDGAAEAAARSRIQASRWRA